jgi:hypothetical protein
MQFDLGVQRQFHLTERVGLRFRAEFFNIFNHPNFGSPVNDLTSPLFGHSTQSLAGSLGSGGREWRIESSISDWRTAFDPNRAETAILSNVPEEAPTGLSSEKDFYR